MPSLVCRVRGPPRRLVATAARNWTVVFQLAEAPPATIKYLVEGRPFGRVILKM
jgi:hypothetical protein